MQSRSVLPLTVLAAAIWAVSALSALMFGAAHIPANDAMGYLWAQLSGGTIAVGDVPDYRIVVDSRLPRVLLATLIGAGLAVVGLVVQAMVRKAKGETLVSWLA
jgi:iron complex transport system permease protein